MFLTRVQVKHLGKFDTVCVDLSCGPWSSAKEGKQRIQQGALHGTVRPASVVLYGARTDAVKGQRAKAKDLWLFETVRDILCVEHWTTEKSHLCLIRLMAPVNVAGSERGTVSMNPHPTGLVAAPRK
ncbi:hypothetical protein OPT61_g2296 [Boeremia exigua]|uniref:Uncharacterized protein n=1 Tax=Boeremia exigua TaxID=749465 RepID=A0ACC2IMA4_9PLEO|nr:hypothetical protein OPT61_g2296 [Boeremia exigua]